MNSWSVSFSDKAWDFDENESCDVVFLDGPLNNQKPMCFVNAGASDSNLQANGGLPGTSDSKQNDG